MSNLDKVLAWAPDYPKAWTAMEADRGVGFSTHKANTLLHKAVPYGIVEYVGYYDGVTWWRKARPEDSPVLPPVMHEARSKYIKAPSFKTSKWADVDRWVESLPEGADFTTRDAMAAYGKCAQSQRVAYFLEHDPRVMEMRHTTTHPRTWRRI